MGKLLLLQDLKVVGRFKGKTLQDVTFQSMMVYLAIKLKVDVHMMAINYSETNLDTHFWQFLENDKVIYIHILQTVTSHHPVIINISIA